jgi:PAS domain S-box-containing protein
MNMSNNKHFEDCEDIDPEDGLNQALRELSCLYELSEAVTSASSLHQMLEQAVSVIPKGFSGENQAQCSITLGSDRYASQSSDMDDESCITLTQPIRIKNMVAGTVSVKTAEYTAGNGKRRLLCAVAERLSHETERFEYIDSMYEQHEKNLATLNAIGDAVISTDCDGRITLINPIAEQLTGWKSEEALGKDVHQVFNIVSSKTGKPVENPADEVLETGVILGLANHTSLISRTGETYHIADNAAPITSPGGQTIGVIIVFRDVSDSYILQQDLKKSRERFAKAFENSPFAVTISRLEDGKLLEVNQAFAGMFGYRQHEAIGKTTTELHIWPQADDRIQFREHLDEHSRIIAYESQLRHRDGSRLFVRFFSELIEINSQMCILSTLEDLTQNRADKIALQETLNIMEGIVNCSPLAVYSFDLGRTVLSWNRAAETLYGWKAEEIIGKALPIIPEYGVDDSISLHSRILDGEGITGAEAVRIHKDGHPIPVRLSAAPLHDSEGKIIGVIGIAENLSAERQLESELLRAEEDRKKLEFIISHGPAVAFLWNADEHWKVDYLSDNISMFGYSPEQFYSGKLAYADIIHEEDLTSVREEVKTLLEDEKRKTMTQTYRIKSAEGEIRWVEDRTFKHLDETGDLRALQGIVFDITHNKEIQLERDRLQSELAHSQKLESIGRLAGGVAHDYNNMLSVIMGYTELAVSQPDNGTSLKHYLAEIDQAAKKASQITQQLLAFARKQAVRPVLVDINSSAHHALNMIRQLIGEDIELRWFPTEAVSCIYIDPTQIDQILTNLCINARDAITGPGTIEISTFETTRDSRQYTCLRISDNGSGMDEETLEHIFEPFFTRKQPGKGTGLGLSTVYGIVKQNDGFIDVSSTPGKGSVFTISFPSQEQVSCVSEKPALSHAKAEVNKTILLVEDERSIRELTARMLADIGYNVHTADGHDQALHAAGKHGKDIHLLLTDVIMPKMNGKKLAQLICSRHPHIRVLFMSGHTADVISQRGEVDEQNLILEKPFTLSQLRAHVQRALES